MQGPTLDGWLEELAAATPAPGGGSAAALAGAMAAALVGMVARLTSGRAQHAAVQGRMMGMIAEADGIRAELRRLVDDDAAAYLKVVEAQKRPADDPARPAAVDEALVEASRTALTIGRDAARVAVLARDIAAIGNPSARSDAVVGEALARAALAGALENVRANAAALTNPVKRAELAAEVERLEAKNRGR